MRRRHFGRRTGQSSVLPALGQYPLIAHQTQVIKRVLDGFEGKLTNAKWAALGKCSADTALCDINDLLARGMLRRPEGGGRSTGYKLCVK
jgi:Fic family protein